MKKAPKSKLKAEIKSRTKTNINLRPAVEARTKAFEDKSLTIRAHHLPAVSKVGVGDPELQSKFY